jgi:hypothetical protein
MKATDLRERFNNLGVRPFSCPVAPDDPDWTPEEPKELYHPKPLSPVEKHLMEYCSALFGIIGDLIIYLEEREGRPWHVNRLGPKESQPPEFDQETLDTIREKLDAAKAGSLPPPVDRSAVCLTDGSPVTLDHRELRPNGQQKGYIVLTPQERAKGFVRPVRLNYVHVGDKPKYPLRDLTEDELKGPQVGYVKFEAYPKGESSVVGRFWTQEQLDKRACGSVTTMGLALAETYARCPDFYSHTMCVACGAHFPVREFVWEGTSEIVGS